MTRIITFLVLNWVIDQSKLVIMVVDLYFSRDNDIHPIFLFKGSFHLLFRQTVLHLVHALRVPLILARGPVIRTAPIPLTDINIC